MTGFSRIPCAGLMLAAMLLTGCQDQKDTNTLAAAEKASSNELASQPADCTASSQVCVRVREEHGAACLKMTEAATPAQRAAMRDCALQDFTAARAQMPSDAPPDMRLRAATGLAEALIIDRDNNPVRRSSDATQIDAVANELRSMPDGAAAAAYFAGNNALNRVLTGGVPTDRACTVLAGARTDLKTVRGSGDLAQRINELQGQIDTAMQPPFRSCA